MVAAGTFDMASMISKPAFDTSIRRSVASCSCAATVPPPTITASAAQIHTRVRIAFSCQPRSSRHRRMLRARKKVFARLLNLRWNFLEFSSKPLAGRNPRLIVQLSFGDCVLDADRRELSRGGTVVHTGPRVFDLLAHLVMTREGVVAKDELLRIVWGGRLVSDSTLTSHIHAARKAIGDSGAEQRLIRTIARKGFRFVGEVRETQPPAERSGLSLTFRGLGQPASD